MFNLFQTFLTLLPPGSLFNKAGKVIKALIEAICWQFQVLVEYYKNSSNQEAYSPDNLDILSTEYNIETTYMNEEQIQETFSFLKLMPMKASRKSFFETLLKFFPRLRIYRDCTSYLNYELAQVNVFETNKSQLAGLDEDRFRKDNVFVAGTVKTLFEKRRLTWFLQRYGRAKHKHIISVTTEESEAVAICGVAQVGVMITGATHPGPI